MNANQLGHGTPGERKRRTSVRTPQQDKIWGRVKRARRSQLLAQLDAQCPLLTERKIKTDGRSGLLSGRNVLDLLHDVRLLMVTGTTKTWKSAEMQKRIQDSQASGFDYSQQKKALKAQRKQAQTEKNEDSRRAKLQAASVHVHHTGQQLQQQAAHTVAHQISGHTGQITAAVVPIGHTMPHSHSMHVSFVQHAHQLSQVPGMDGSSQMQTQIPQMQMPRQSSPMLQAPAMPDIGQIQAQVPQMQAYQSHVPQLMQIPDTSQMQPSQMQAQMLQMQLPDANQMQGQVPQMQTHSMEQPPMQSQRPQMQTQQIPQAQLSDSNQMQGQLQQMQAHVPQIQAHSMEQPQMQAQRPQMQAQQMPQAQMPDGSQQVQGQMAQMQTQVPQMQAPSIWYAFAPHNTGVQGHSQISATKVLLWQAVEKNAGGSSQKVDSGLELL
mmetsp:Transcript_34061/g.53083  ORF Transcript_34061/g.53083 Transcript_34061/m.53083 type:complete len:436 (+) Transcript_34061:372-1679(+)